MTSFTRILPAVVMLGLASACWSARAEEGFPSAGIVGSWRGSGQIIVNWCKETNLPVAIAIASDGSVTGKVGDAVLTHGRFKRNRGPIGRTLNIRTDYIITGKLEGPIIAAEGITRKSVNVPLNWKANSLAGGLHTSGLKMGGKKRMILSARLSLTPIKTP